MMGGCMGRASSSPEHTPLSVAVILLLAGFMAVCLTMPLLDHSAVGGEPRGGSDATPWSAGRDQAVTVLKQYIECERGDWKPCFALLSKDALQIWASQGVKTKEEYDEVRRSDESSFGELKVLQMEQVGRALVVKSKIKRFGVASDTAYIHFYLVKEDGQWKIDRMKEGPLEYLP